MIRLIAAVVFPLALASSALAMTPARLQQPSDVVIKIRQACGPGMHYVNGACTCPTCGQQVREGSDLLIPVRPF